MKIAKRASYLRERVYGIKENNFEISPDVISYWEKLLGKDCLKKNRNNVDNLDFALADQSYECEEKCVLKFKTLSRMGEYSEKHDSINIEVIKMNEEEVFFEFYVPFYRMALDYYDKHKINNTILINSDKDIKKCIVDILSNRFSDVCTRVLILEMNICREEGLEGETEEDKYRYYVKKMLESQKYCEEIFNIYPCMERILLESILILVGNVIEITEKLLKDREKITAILCRGKVFTRINSMKSEFSDSHNGGKAVFTLELDNGYTILYKPHSLKSEVVYQKFLGWIVDMCKDRMFQYKIIDCVSYGWVEKVDYCQCESEEEVTRYYQRVGYILFTNYLLQVTDMHYENMIAHGAYPVVIDLETIMGNKILSKKVKKAVDIAYDNIWRSVLSQGLLPKYAWSKNDKQGIDISGIAGVAGQEIPVKLPVVKHNKRADMRIEYENPVTGGKKNIPYYNGKVLTYEDYTDEIIRGFETAYRMVLHDKETALKKAEVFGDLTVRYLPRDTRQYAMLLRTSYHPDFMQDGRDRELLIRSLYQGITDERYAELIEEEVQDIIAGDIPYFMFQVDEKKIRSSKGIESKTIFQESSYEEMRHKICNLSEKDLADQILYIVLSMESTQGTIPISKSETKTMAINDQYLEKIDYGRVVMSIFDIIYEQAVFSPQKDDVNWIGISLIGQNENIWNVAPLGNYLYDGISGVAVFIFAMRKIYSSPKIDLLCSCLKKTLLESIEEMLKRANSEIEISGAFCGNSSLMYSCQILYRLTGDTEFFRYMERVYDKIATLLVENHNSDIIFGHAGSILVLLNAYELSRQEKYINCAINLAEQLEKNAVKISKDYVGWVSENNARPLAGFSHGNSGIALALLKLAYYTKRRKYYVLAKQAIQYEDSLYDDQKNNWLDMRVFSGQEVKDIGDPVAWCHGAGGILLARVKMLQYVDEDLKKTIYEDIEKAKRKILENGMSKMQCLCHGNMGNVEILIEAARIMNDKELNEFSQHVLENIIQDTNDKGWNVGQPGNAPNVGFMLGISGIGYSLLKNSNVSLFPSILSVEV